MSAPTSEGFLNWYHWYRDYGLPAWRPTMGTREITQEDYNKVLAELSGLLVQRDKLVIALREAITLAERGAENVTAPAEFDEPLAQWRALLDKLEAPDHA